MKDFLRGVGSVINLFPLERKGPSISDRSDIDAIKSDWEKVGKDMRFAIEKNNLSEKKQKSHE